MRHPGTNSWIPRQSHRDPSDRAHPGHVLLYRHGSRLQGFDEPEKYQQELDARSELGLRFINSHLSNVTEHTAFINYARVGHPEIMGFPSGYSDTRWMRDKPYDETMEFILSAMNTHADNGDHMPVMLHDWVA